MEKYYYNTETDALESIDTLRSDYTEFFADDYDNFDTYLACCMVSENGTLITARDRLREVKDELNHKLMLSRKYGYDEYAEELTALLAEMDRLSKYTRGGN